MSTAGFFVVLGGVVSLVGHRLYLLGVKDGKRKVERKINAKEAAVAAAKEAEQKKVVDYEPDYEPFPEEVCLRVGMHVVCRLSESAHTHGVILGFTMRDAMDGPMLAIVDVNASHPMPIDVDRVEPRGREEAVVGYRESTDPSKWN